MDLLLYVHVDADHFVIPSTAHETILDVIQRSEAAYASLFRTRPPLTIDAVKNDAGCFLPSSLAVGQVLQSGAHVTVVASSPSHECLPNDCTLQRLIATWKHWQLYFAQALCAVAQQRNEATMDQDAFTALEVFSHLSSLCCSSNDQILQLALDCVKHWLPLMAIDDSTSFLAHLLSAKPVLASSTLLNCVLDLVGAFAKSSREAQVSLIARDVNARLLDIAAARPHVQPTIEPIVAMLHAIPLRHRNTPLSSSSCSNLADPPSMAMQELLFCMHGKQRQSQDVATQQLVQLSQSLDTWQAAVKGADAALFAELLHVTTANYTPGDAFSETQVTRVLQTMTNVVAFQPHTLVVHDPHAIDTLVTIGHQAAYPPPMRQQAATLLRHVLERQGHLGYTNVAGLVGLLQSTHSVAQAVGAAALLAALDGKAKVNPAHTHDVVFREMSSCHVPALVDALYALDVATRVTVLLVLNVLLQEEDVRQLVAGDLGCIPALVSIFLDIGVVEGQRQAAKALSKLALSSPARNQEVSSAMEYVVSRDAVADSVVMFYLDLIHPPSQSCR